MRQKYHDDESEFEQTKTVQEVAELLGVHWQTILAYIRDGKLDAIRMGNRYRITASSYREFIEKRIATPKYFTIQEYKYEIKPIEL